MIRLSLEHLTVRHAGRPAVADLTLAVLQGAGMALLGANGAGKSSLMRAVMGLIPAASGRVMLDGVDITARPAPWRARHGIGYCPEGRRPFPGLSVRENLAVACWADRRERRRRIEASFCLFPALAAHADRLAWQLSGGQQQMLALARALMNAPRLLLLDEPTLGLAPIVADDVLAHVPAIIATGTTVLLAEQSVRALAVCDHAAVLSQGRMVACGRSAELADRDAIRSALLGA